MKNKKLSRKVSSTKQLSAKKSNSSLYALVAAIVLGILFVFWPRFTSPNVSEVSQTQITFTDVPSDYWAYNSIINMVNKGVMAGFDATSFHPNDALTRAEAARYLLRLEHGNSYTPPSIANSPTGSKFSDVPNNHWAIDWIHQLVNEGISAGCGGNKFCPDSTFTRDQLAVLILKAKYGSAYVPPAATGLIFSDVPKTQWAAKWIEALKIANITSGCTATNYCPSTPVTRAQMAVFSEHFLNLPAVTFGDVPSTHWASNAIYKMVSSGYMTGCTASQFCPNAPLTRADASRYFVTLRHGTSYTPPEILHSNFTDVPLGYSSVRWIHQLVADGISAGCGNNKFCPDTAVTRAQLAVLMLRAKKGSSYVPPSATGTVFTDVAASSFGAAWIEQAKALGITAGCSTTTYCPTKAVTRAEMAVFLQSAVNLPN